MVTLASTIIDRVMKKYLSNDAVTTITVALTSSDTSIEFQVIVHQVGLNSVLMIEEELIKVISVDNTAGTGNIIRGHLGTTAAAHVIDSPMYINPRIQRDDVFPLINNALVDMVPSLYQTATKSLSYSGSAIGYDMAITDGILEVIRVTGQTDSSSKNWNRILDWTWDDDPDGTDFPIGPAFFLRSALPSGALFRVKYSLGFTAITAEDDDLEADSGLRPYMIDLPYYYAMSRLMIGEEIERSVIKTAVSHQRAQDVPPFLAIRTGEWYQARYRDLLNTCRLRLMKENQSNLVGSGYGS